MTTPNLSERLRDLSGRLHAKPRAVETAFAAALAELAALEIERLTSALDAQVAVNADLLAKLRATARTDDPFAPRDDENESSDEVQP